MFSAIAKKKPPNETRATLVFQALPHHRRAAGSGRMRHPAAMRRKFMRLGGYLCAAREPASRPWHSVAPRETRAGIP